jgi:hypothetical protein
VPRSCCELCAEVLGESNSVMFWHRRDWLNRIMTLASRKDSIVREKQQCEKVFYNKLPFLGTMLTSWGRDRASPNHPSPPKNAHQTETDRKSPRLLPGFSPPSAALSAPIRPHSPPISPSLPLHSHRAPRLPPPCFAPVSNLPAPFAPLLPTPQPRPAAGFPRPPRRLSPPPKRSSRSSVSCPAYRCTSRTPSPRPPSPSDASANGPAKASPG